MLHDLAHADAKDLIHMEFSELLPLIKATKQWSDGLCARLDHAYRHRVVRALAGRASSEELRPLHDHLRRVAQRLRAVHPGGQHDWSQRCRAYADVIDARLATLDSQDLETTLQRAHVRDVLRLLLRYPKGITQQELLARLGVQKANLTRVLNLMEANELVVRKGEGREKRVLEGPLARKHPPPPTQAVARTRAPKDKSQLAFHMGEQSVLPLYVPTYRQPPVKRGSDSPVAEASP